MKNNKKFILAAGAAALGLVAATGVTSGFAWFAVNSTATVTGMQLSAKSDQPFLLIAAADGKSTPAQSVTTMAQLQTANTKSVTSNINAEVLPVAPEAAVATGHYATGAVETANNWYYMTSNDPTVSTGANGTKQNVSASNTDYVITATFSVGLAVGSANVTGLYLSSVTFSGAPTGGDYSGLSIIIASEEKGYLFTDGTGLDREASPNAQYYTDHSIYAPVGGITAADENPVTLKAYIFIDGTDDNVTSVKKALLGGTIGFTVDTYVIAA